MAGEKQSMSQLADEYFGDISMFKVQRESSTENAGESVEKKELLETSIDEALNELTSNEDVSSRPIQADNNGDTGLPETSSARDAGENVEQEDSGCGREYKGRSVERSLYHDACFLSEDVSEGKTGESEDKEMDEVKLDSLVPSEEGEIKEDEEGAVDEQEEPGNSGLQHGKPEDMGYHGERRRNSFGYFDGSFEDLSIMVFPEEAPRRRKSSLGTTIIIVPNEPKVPEGENDEGTDIGETGENVGDKQEDRNIEGSKGFGKRHVALQVGEDEENVNEMEDGKDKDGNERVVGGGFALRDVAVQVDEGGENVMEDENNKCDEGDNNPGNRSGGLRDVAVQVGEDDENVGENQEENELENIPEEDEGVQHGEAWTLLEAWTGFAGMVGAMPYRIERNNGQSEIRTSGFSKLKWACTSVLSAIKTVNVIPTTFAIFHGKDNPLAFLKLGGNFAQVVMYVLFWRTVIYKQKYLLQANNRLISSYSHCTMSKLITGLLIFTMMIIVFANTSLYIAYRTKLSSTGDFYSIQTIEISKMLECHGQEALTWNNGNCIHAEFLSPTNIFWSGVGLIITANSIIIQTVVVIGIITFCISFFLATYEVRARQADMEHLENENNVVTREDYFNLVDFAGELSSFIGESVLAYLMVHGLETPIAIPNLFSESIVVFLSIMLNNGIIVIGLLLSAVATLWMKWIWDGLMGQEVRQQRPTGSARLRALANEMLFRKSGIGIPGLLVINFPIMFTYLATLGALYIVVYDVGKN